MRFKTFLEAAPHIEAARNKAAFALFNGFKQSLAAIIDHKALLYRGAGTSGSKRFTLTVDGIEDHLEMNVTKISGRAEPRNSQSSDNTLLYASVEWKGFPDRRFSTFTTQYVHHADRFATPKLVIPADSVKEFGWIPGDFNEPSGPEKQAKKHAIKLAYHIRLLVAQVADTLRDELLKGQEFRNKLMDIAEDNNVRDEIEKTFYRPSIPQEKLFNLVAFCDSLIKRQKQLKDMQKNDRHEVMERIWALMEFLDGEGLGTTKEALTDLVSPKNFGAKSFSSLSQLPKAEGLTEERPSEVWFAGDYLLVNFDHDLTEIDVDLQIKILKVLQEKLK